VICSDDGVRSENGKNEENGRLEGRNEKIGCCGQFLTRLCRITVKLESKKQVFMDENMLINCA
jgi:hypothetical protein